MSQTELLYFFDPATVGTATALSVGKEGERDYVILDRTFFHPAGGGQKSDLGTIGGVPVVKAERREAEVFHFLGGAPGFDARGEVSLEVDAAARALNSQWHTAGHLVGSVMERVLGCKATGGQHWPGESFMRFEHEVAPTAEEMQRCLEEMDAVIREDRAVSIRMDGASRLVTIEGYDAVPCGGTHVTSTARLGGVELGTPKVKQRRLQVSYKVLPTGSAT
jgi:alanyl-tRNA synthetase